MVIHIITRLAMGGAQQLVFEIANRMHQSKKKVTIFTGLSDTKKSLSGRDNKILDMVYKEQIPVEIIPSLIDRISLIHDLKALIGLCIMLRKYKPSIVHIHSSKAGILARIACRLIGVKKVIYHVHGWSYGRATGFSRSFYLLLERIFYYLTTKYIFVCQQDMIDFIKLGGNPRIRSKSCVIYPGASFLNSVQKNHYRSKLRRKLGFSDADHVVGTVARMDFQKNPQIFVKIASRFADVCNNARFLWIGKGVYKIEIENLIEKSGLSDKFVLPGYIDEADLYFSVFDTFIITSRYEGLPVTPLKAIACGIPVVGFCVNGIKDLSIRFKQFFGVDSDDIDEFVQQLINAKKMFEEEKEMLDREGGYVRNSFNIDSMYGDIIKVYESI
jgi:glycosyltransferase involved in cell wall biosynthesis